VRFSGVGRFKPPTPDFFERVLRNRQWANVDVLEKLPFKYYTEWI
jgi:hypothetical protein